MFAAHDYNMKADPLDRVFAYLDLRRSFLDMPLPDFSCVAGTTVQETFQTYPAIRAAADESLRSGAAHVQAHLAAALTAHPVPGVSAQGIALQFQVAVQSGIVVAKVFDDSAAERAAFDHFER